MNLNIQTLLNDDKCYEAVRQKRWPDGVRCPHCDGIQITKQGRDSTQPARQKYFCKSCQRFFDDLTGTVFAGHHQPLKVWILCIYFMGLNLSNQQIAKELELNKDDVQRMTQQLRVGIVTRQVEPVLTDTVECDEVYVVAGHKGNPDAVEKKPQRTQETSKRSSRARYSGEGKTPNPWNDRAWWSCNHKNAGKCSTSNHFSLYQAFHISWNDHPHGRVRHL